jgi:hypothetical protein
MAYWYVHIHDKDKNAWVLTNCALNGKSTFKVSCPQWAENRTIDYNTQLLHQAIAKLWSASEQESLTFHLGYWSTCITHSSTLTYRHRDYRQRSSPIVHMYSRKRNTRNWRLAMLQTHRAMPTQWHPVMDANVLTSVPNCQGYSISSCFVQEQCVNTCDKSRLRSSIHYYDWLIRSSTNQKLKSQFSQFRCQIEAFAVEIFVAAFAQQQIRQLAETPQDAGPCLPSENIQTVQQNNCSPIRPLSTLLIRTKHLQHNYKNYNYYQPEGWQDLVCMVTATANIHFTTL